MADLSVEEPIEKYGPRELARHDLLVLDDPSYNRENVAIVTGAGAEIGQATALAFAANGVTVGATVSTLSLYRIFTIAMVLANDGSTATVTDYWPGGI